MKVALIRAKYNPFGGAERFVETAVGALAAQGVSLTILTRQWPENVQNVNPALHHVVINPRYVTSTGRDSSFANAVTEHLGTTKYDLAQSHERIVGCDIFRAGDGVHAAWLAQRARGMDKHGDSIKRLSVKLNPHHHYLLRTEREMFLSPLLRAVICNSAMVKADILRHFDIDETKLRVILSGVDSQKFHPGLRDEFRLSTRKKLKITKGAPVALFVGSGFERKGLSGFLLGLADQAGSAQLADKGVRGIVVGHDKHLAHFQTRANQLGLADRVVFTGGVEDVRPYYAAADILVLPTLYDPLPNACLEAMACGLPTITSTTSGAAELITDDVEGYVTDALDVSAISAAIGHTLDDARMVKMGLRARERVRMLTPEAMATSYIALYRELLGLPG
ncbi:MAG: glycosyltransferase family 4 protein [Pseudomonadota bacterium]